MEMTMTKSCRVLLLAAALAATSACGGRENREVPIGKAGEAELSISGTEAIEGTGLLRATIAPRRRGGYDSGPSGYAEDYVRNIVIIDPATGANRRLLPSNTRTILDNLWLADAAGTVNARRRDESSDAPVAFYILSVRQPGESRLIDILTGKIADGPATPIITGAQELYSATALGDGRVALLFAKVGRAMHVLVDIDEATIISETPVAIQ